MVILCEEHFKTRETYEKFIQFGMDFLAKEFGEKASLHGKEDFQNTPVPVELVTIIGKK